MTDSSLERLVLVSTGTSIYTSLSWNSQAFQDRDWGQQYATWQSDPEYQDSPRKRARAESLEYHLRETLAGDNALPLAEQFAGDNWDTKPRRYSAELTTILRLAQKKKPRSPQQWAGESHFVFISDEDMPKGGSRIAALHNQECLSAWAELKPENVANPILIKGLESDNPDNFGYAQVRAVEAAGKQAKAYLDAGKEVFFVVSGGFKITACLAGIMMPPKTCLVYQHDSVGSLYYQQIIDIAPVDQNTATIRFELRGDDNRLIRPIEGL